MRNPFQSTPWSTPWSRLPATAGVVVSTVVLAGLTYAAWRALRSTHTSRQSAKPARQPEDLTRWEGEGGGVPVGGARTAAEMSPGTASTGAGTTARSGSSGTPLGSGVTGSTGSLPH